MSETEEGKRLIKAESFLYVINISDIEWSKAKPENNRWLKYYEEHKGQGEPILYKKHIDYTDCYPIVNVPYIFYLDHYFEKSILILTSEYVSKKLIH